MRARGWERRGGVCIPLPSSEPPDLSRSFQTEQTSWGTFVTSIHGLAGNKTKRTYWQFFSCWSPLQEGGHPGACGAQGAVLGGLHVPASCIPLLQGSAPTSRKTGSTSRPSSAPTDTTKTPRTPPRSNKVPFQHVPVHVCACPWEKSQLTSLLSPFLLNSTSSAPLLLFPSAAHKHSLTQTPQGQFPPRINKAFPQQPRACSSGHIPVLQFNLS